MKRILLGIVALVLVAAAGAFYVIAYTQTGIELAAAQLGRLERLGIRIEGISGRLTGPLRIARFEMDHERVHVVIENIDLDLHLRWLALQTIDITSATATSALVELKPAPDAPPPATPPRFLPDFLRIAIDRIDIAAITVRLANGRAIELDRAQGAAQLRSDRLSLDELSVTGPLFAARGTLELAAARPMGLEFAGSGTYFDGTRPDLELTANVKGTVEDMQVEGGIIAPVTATIAGHFTRPEESWQFEGRTTAPAIPLAPWVPGSTVVVNDLALAFSLTPDVMRLTGQVTVPAVDAAPLRIDGNGRFADRTLTLNALEVTQLNARGRLLTAGSVIFDGEAPTLDLTTEWRTLNWPLTGAPPRISSPSGRLTLTGPLPYDFNVDAAVTIAGVPPVSGVVKGSLSRELLTVSEYSLAALDGIAAGAATLELAAPRRWTLSTAARDINPLALHEEFDGRLELVAEASGTGTTPAADFSLSVTRLRGVLRGQPINASGRVGRDAQGWQINDAAATFGPARATVAGRVKDDVDLEWTFDASSLAEVLPGGEGRLRFNGSAKGALRLPHVQAEIDGAGLEYMAWNIGEITASADVDLSGVAASRLSVEAEDVGRGAVRADTLKLSGQGNGEAHSLRVELASRAPGGKVANTEFAIDGRFATGTWTGQVASTRLFDAGGNALRLSEPAQVTVSRDAADVQRLCLYVLESNFCGSGHWERNGPWQADLAGEDLPLDVIGLVLQDQPRYLGDMDITVTASGSPEVDWLGNASIVLTGAAIEYRLSSDDARTVEVVQIGSGRADLRATSDALSATVGLAVQTESFIAANATVTRTQGVPLAESPLAGGVRARMGDANLLPLLVPEIDHAAGVLNADVALTGQLNAPELAGRIDLNRGALDLYRLNLALRDIEMGVTLATTGLQFASKGSAGTGTWNLDGALAWRNGAPSGTLRLKGENLLVADLPDYRVVASPDLGFRINGRTINATGEVVIPSARIQPTDLSGAVQISPDSHLVNDIAATESRTFDVTSDIRVTLGDDVQLDTFGLEGKLAGSVGTTLKTGEIAVGRGELSVSNGKYEAYGQSLDITRGRLLFGASPLDDPGLDIQAERTVEAIKVGMNVRGTLREPRFGFYSEPAMSQTQILSYLLVGKPIDDLQNRDTATVGSASDALALQGGGILAAQIGRRLGLAQVGIEAQGANQALVLGRFLSPRLFVSYGISLTESINTLKLRYTISDRWVLKTESGENQSADVEFTIERP